jgi:DNA end-binding protein Ku
MLKLAEHIIETKSGEFEPSEFVDRYVVELVELLKAKQGGLPAKKPSPAIPRPTGANIFDLLRRSVELEGKAKKTKAPPLPVVVVVAVPGGGGGNHGHGH